jgi:hypothetical protein
VFLLHCGARGGGEGEGVYFLGDAVDVVVYGVLCVVRAGAGAIGIEGERGRWFQVRGICLMACAIVRT